MPFLLPHMSFTQPSHLTPALNVKHHHSTSLNPSGQPQVKEEAEEHKKAHANAKPEPPHGHPWLQHVAPLPILSDRVTPSPGTSQHLLDTPKRQVEERKYLPSSCQPVLTLARDTTPVPSHRGNTHEPTSLIRDHHRPANLPDMPTWTRNHCARRHLC